MQIDHGAAGVSWIDGGIRLNKILIVLDSQILAAGGAHDTHGRRLTDAEGVSDGEDHVAHLEP